VSPSFLELRISRWCTLACGGGTSSWLRAFEGATRFSSGTLRTRGLRLVELEETLGVLAMIFLFFFNFLFFLHFSFHFSFHFFSLSSLHSLSLALIGCRKWRCQRASTHTRTRTHTHTHTHTLTASASSSHHRHHQHHHHHHTTDTAMQPTSGGSSWLRVKGGELKCCSTATTVSVVRTSCRRRCMSFAQHHRSVHAARQRNLFCNASLHYRDCC
jgi:ABC-type nickel/cobalt efflux system permease component RcnA